MKWLRGLALLVLSLTLVAPASALQLAENDDAFDAAGYNGATEDSLTVLPLDDFYPPMTLEWTYNFDVDISGGGIFGGGSTQVDTDLSIDNEPAYSEEEQFQKKSSENPLPRANIQLSTTLVKPGSEVVATAQPENFYAPGGLEELFFAWGFNGVAFNGVAAGGDSSDLPLASSPAGFHTRPPATDHDNDGMDDDWEVRYGLDPTNPADAGFDSDGDGYTNDVYANALGEVLIVEPETSAGPPGGAFTNYKEYLWGTDPNNPDTDGDGFSDGQDVAGLGQVTVPFRIPDTAVPGDQFELRLTVLGKSSQQFDKETYLTKVDSSTVTLIVTDGEQARARLSIDDDHPAPGQTVLLEAELGQTEYHRGTYDYVWFVNNVQDAGSGLSNYTLEYQIPTSAHAGDLLEFSVIARNYDTGGEAVAVLEVRVGEIVQLEYDPSTVIVGQPLSVRATLHSNTILPEELVFHWSKNGREIIEQSGPGRTTYTEEIAVAGGEEINLQLRITTSDDSKLLGLAATNILVAEPIVEVVSEDYELAPGEAILAVAAAQNFGTTDLTYNWSIDGVEQSLPPDEDAITIIGGADGSSTSVSVTVSSTMPQAQTASDTKVFTVAAQNISEAGRDSTSQNLLASLIAGGLRVPLLLGIVGATVAGLLGIVFVMRRKNV